MRPLKTLLLLATAALQAHATAAAWTAKDLDRLTQQLAAGMSQAAGYGSTLYPWQFLSCTPSDKNCFGTNPDSPYGAPNFGPAPDGSNRSVTPLASSDALVLVMETPPAMRYFGVTSYLFSRYYPNQLPSAPATTPGFVPVFESLNDTVNLDVIRSTGGSQPGVNPFGQLSLMVMTADAVTQAQIRDQLTALAVPATAVNWINLPYRDAALHMGTAPTSDTYTLLLRMAYPADSTPSGQSASLDDYKARAPLRVLLLRAPATHQGLPVATPRYRSPGSPPAEAASLAQAQDALVSQLQARFLGSYTITESPVTLAQTQNYVCIEQARQCAGDNSDALYASDVSHFRPASPQDRLLVVGVNHVLQGKATYLSHSLVAAKNDMGVLGVSDTWLKGTALSLAGVSDPSDPRYATYSQLYAFTLAYDCHGDPVCVTIPQPSGTQLGIPYGDPINLTGRTYLDPTSQTRPSAAELIPHRVFILRRP